MQPCIGVSRLYGSSVLQTVKNSLSSKLYSVVLAVWLECSVIGMYLFVFPVIYIYLNSTMTTKIVIFIRYLLHEIFFILIPVKFNGI